MAIRRQMSVAIVGAGIGGLAAAAALRQVGFEPVVFEQADAFARVGAGIQQSPNAVKIHRGLHIEERLRAVAFAPSAALDRDGASGKAAGKFPLGREAEARYGAPYLTLHRAELHAALAATAPAGSVQLGKTLVAIEPHAARYSLTFADGSEATADAVIGADGVHSRVREFVASPMPARFCGRISYRASFPATRLRGLDIGNARTRWRGRDRHIVMSYVNAARDEVQFTTSQPDAAADLARESWSAAGDPTAMRQAFLSFHSDVQAVLSAAPQVHAWPIHERAPLSTWSRGCVVLLGDACHPATPDLVSGAALALEDAVVLARCLDEFHDIGVEAALRTYEATRKPRTSLVQASSAGAQMRNQSSPDWLYGYDAWRVPLRATMDNF